MSEPNVNWIFILGLIIKIAVVAVIFWQVANLLDIQNDYLDSILGSVSQ